MNCFTNERLSQMVFQNGMEAKTILEREARNSGFDLYSRNNIMDPHPVFYCSFGGRKGNKPSNKTNCPFYLRFKPKNRKNINEGLIFSKGNLNHIGHQLDSSLYSHDLLEDNQKELINGLHFAGCSKKVIQNYVLSIGGPFLSSINIEKIIYHRCIMDFSHQTQDLIQYMNDTQGSSFSYEIENETEIQRMAVFTISSEEKNNLMNYMDVVFIDPTFINLENQWTLIPITLVSNTRNILSGGMVFTAITNEEILHWILNILLFEFNGIQNTKSIVTDEDSAFIPAFKNIKKTMEMNNETFTIDHILCSYHKMKNWHKCIAKSSLNKNERIEAKILISKVCYSDSRKEVDHSIRELCDLDPVIKAYTDKNIIPILGQFSRGYLSNKYCLGYNTTSVSESMNYLIKRNIGSQVLTLKAARSKINSILFSHMSLIKHRLVLQRKFLTQLEIEGNFELSKKIRDMLIIEIDKSKEIMLTASNDIIYAFDYRNPEKSYEIQNNIRCECGLDVFCGIPCRHIISLYRFQNTQLPLSLFNRRWFLNSTNEMQSNDRFFQPQYQNTGQLKYIDHQDHDDTINSDQRIRFISLFYSLKELASLASRSIESSVQVSNWVNIITNEVLNINDNESDININDSGQKEIRDIRDTLAKRKDRKSVV